MPNAVNSTLKVLPALMLAVFTYGCGVASQCTDPIVDQVVYTFNIQLESAATGEAICDATIRVTRNDGFSETLNVTIAEPQPEDPDPELRCAYQNAQTAGKGVYSMDVYAPGFQSIVIDDIRIEEHSDGPNCGAPITYSETIELEPDT